MGTKASQITSLEIVYSTIYSGTDKKNTSKLCVTGLCVGNSPGTGVFPAQMTSNAENVSIWWRHHVSMSCHHHGTHTTTMTFRFSCGILKFRHLGQRKYRSGEMYWMTFPWPWPKVMAVALIKNACLHNKENHTSNHYRTWQLYPPGHTSHLSVIEFWWNSVINFFFKISDVFFHGQILDWND